MKKGCIGLIVLGVIALALFGWVKNSYNGLVSTQESVEKAWGNVESQYQRRADLIPNLVETVKGYAKHEQETFEKVIEARANVGSALSRLIAVAENYPDLKANQNFLDLQSQLEGTENRITVARNDFNEEARKYNTQRRTFPTNIIASIFNFGDKPYFQAQEGADKAPKVDFGTSEGK